MNEKEEIEKATADIFIKLYNTKMGSSFSIIEYSDAPDIQCTDPHKNKFNFEITLTEDKPNDIKALLGRSDHKRWEKTISEIKTGKTKAYEVVSCLQGNVTETIISRIKPKFKKDYGKNVALVIRDTSPLNWEWDTAIDQIKLQLNLNENPFNKGIWIITYTMDKIYRIA